MAAALFALELIAITVWLDGGSLNRNSAITLWMWSWGAAILRSVVAFAGLFAVLAWLRARPEVVRIGEEAVGRPIAWSCLAGHAAAMAFFIALAPQLFGGSRAGVIAIAWMSAGLAAIVLAAIAFVPLSLWRQLLRATGNVWIYALAAAILAGCFGVVVRALWEPAARLTFVIVRLLLSPILGRFFAEPANLRLGTPSFDVTIEPECSGLEGIGLVAIFGAVWLWLFRRDLRFPQALFLVPAGMVAAFVLNSVRIAILVLIGNAGAPGVAMGGFHSQAGWIAFNMVAIGLTLVAERIPGVARNVCPRAAKSAADATAAYLLPFLAILAAAMISKAVSGGFEWLYPLRFFAAGSVLWWYRKEYRRLDWQFGWTGAAAGVLVFAMWIAVDRLFTTNVAGGAVVAGGGAGWILWLVLRALGAIVTVPMAEELAFRGYLLRRFTGAGFERIDFRGVSVSALLLSSLLFGLMHGARWFAGALAGLLYALAVRRRGRIGEAVAAHAVTNALLAAWVISRGEWRLW